MSKTKKGEGNPMYARTLRTHAGKNHSEETRARMSNIQKGRPRTEGSGKPSQKIQVYDGFA